MKTTLVSDSGSPRGAKTTLVSDGSIYIKRKGKYISSRNGTVSFTTLERSAMVFDSMKDAKRFIEEDTNVRVSTLSFYKDVHVSYITVLSGGRTIVEYENKFVKI